MKNIVHISIFSHCAYCSAMKFRFSAGCLKAIITHSFYSINQHMHGNSIIDFEKAWRFVFVQLYTISSVTEASLQCQENPSSSNAYNCNLSRSICITVVYILCHHVIHVNSFNMQSPCSICRPFLYPFHLYCNQPITSERMDRVSHIGLRQF